MTTVPWTPVHADAPKYVHVSVRGVHGGARSLRMRKSKRARDDDDDPPRHKQSRGKQPSKATYRALVDSLVDFEEGAVGRDEIPLALVEEIVNYLESVGDVTEILDAADDEVLLLGLS